MLRQNELKKNSNLFSVPPSTIDQDWTLGHLLHAMYLFPSVQDNFVFKGGTAIRKCYLEDYRFSEDLDFTLRDQHFPIDEPFVERIIDLANKNSGIYFSLDYIKTQFFDDTPQGYEIIIRYWGANHSKNKDPYKAKKWHDYIKLDISYAERLVTQPELKPIIHPYSDSGIIENYAIVYSIEEILAEKLRSLIQRNRARDVYDLWYFSQNLINEFDLHKVKRLLIEKSINKRIIIQTGDQFIDSMKHRKIKRAWEKSLEGQLPFNKIPDFDKAYNALPQFIEKILNA